MYILMYYNLYHVSDLTRYYICMEIECNGFVLVLIQDKPGGTRQGGQPNQD